MLYIAAGGGNSQIIRFCFIESLKFTKTFHTEGVFYPARLCTKYCDVQKCEEPIRRR